MIPLIAVIGARQCDERIAGVAFEVGAEIASHGYGLVCGGKGGVMQAAAQGCKYAGGLTVGILPSEKFSEANPFIDIVIPTGMGVMRNLLIIRCARGVIAVSGGYGTLSEIAYALQLSTPVIGIETWDISKDIAMAESAHQAIQKLVEGIRLSGEPSKQL
jgi:uncharacterized protein (TIGR00725 family)